MAFYVNKIIFMSVGNELLPWHKPTLLPKLKRLTQ